MRRVISGSALWLPPEDGYAKSITSRRSGQPATNPILIKVVRFTFPEWPARLATEPPGGAGIEPRPTKEISRCDVQGTYERAVYGTLHRFSPICRGMRCGCADRGLPRLAAARWKSNAAGRRCESRRGRFHDDEQHVVYLRGQ